MFPPRLLTFAAAGLVALSVGHGLAEPTKPPATTNALPLPSEKEAMKAVSGPACEAVRLRLQNASFQHRMMERSAVDAIPGRLSGKSR